MSSPEANCVLWYSPPTTVESKSRIRNLLMAEHTDWQIDQLVYNPGWNHITAPIEPIPWTIFDVPLLQKAKRSRWLSRLLCGSKYLVIFSSNATATIGDKEQIIHVLLLQRFIWPKKNILFVLDSGFASDQPENMKDWFTEKCEKTGIKKKRIHFIDVNSKNGSGIVTPTSESNHETILSLLLALEHQSKERQTEDSQPSATAQGTSSGDDEKMDAPPEAQGILAIQEKFKKGYVKSVPESQRIVRPIVIGIVTNGQFSLGDHITLEPAHVPAVITSIQVFNQPVDQVSTGVRVGFELGLSHVMTRREKLRIFDRVSRYQRFSYVVKSGSSFYPANMAPFRAEVAFAAYKHFKNGMTQDSQLTLINQSGRSTVRISFVDPSPYSTPFWTALRQILMDVYRLQFPEDIERAIVEYTIEDYLIEPRIRESPCERLDLKPLTDVCMGVPPMDRFLLVSGWEVIGRGKFGKIIDKPIGWDVGPRG